MIRRPRGGLFCVEDLRQTSANRKPRGGNFWIEAERNRGQKCFSVSEAFSLSLSKISRKIFYYSLHFLVSVIFLMSDR